MTGEKAFTRYSSPPRGVSDPPKRQAGVEAEMLDTLGTGGPLRASSNRLNLAPDTDPDQPPRLWTNWWFQGEDTAPATQVIHPPGI